MCPLCGSYSCKPNSLTYHQVGSPPCCELPALLLLPTAADGVAAAAAAVAEVDGGGGGDSCDGNGCDVAGGGEGDVLTEGCR